MLPWLMQRKRVAIADMAKQFNMSESDLIEDIELASMCGLPPYSPYELTEVYIDEDYILVGPNKYFERRLELTSSEAFGLSLLAAAAEEMPGFTRGKELKSALKKLRKILGEGIVDVDVESPQFLNEVTEASQSGERLRVTYWTPARNEESERLVTVRSVFTDRGHWYIAADDDASGDRRHFRVDRIRKVEATGIFVAVATEPVQVPVFHYTRKWLQKHAQSNMERAPQQLKMARQMDLPVELAIPLRVIASNVAISCQLDCRVGVRELAEALIPGYADPIEA
jgi:predicted DNA-binding transcriptional regulator YafY